MTAPIVAILGRPNTGKSTLLNRLVGERKAVTSLVPGTTRDRLYASTTLEGRSVTFVDTGGLEAPGASTLLKEVREQIMAALSQADLALFVADAHDGVLASDHEVADLLRRAAKPVLLVVNKVDTDRHRQLLPQFHELALGEPIPISAYHNRGIDELISDIVARLPAPVPEPEAQGPPPMKVAITGRPNVGKSMLLNAILGEKRVIVHDMPGTTRDAIDTLVKYEGEDVLLIDTAGIRRRGKVEHGIEQYSVLRVHQTTERADVALLVVDATEGLTSQDMHVLGFIQEAEKGAVIVVNKWDLVQNQDEAGWEEVLRQRIKFMGHAPILFTSAKTGLAVEKVLPAAKAVYQQRLKRLPDDKVDALIQEAFTHHAPQSEKNRKRLRIYKASQVGVNPPVFEMVVNDGKLVHFTYRRYLENRIRQAFGFEGTALRLQFKNRPQKRHDKTG